MKTLYVPHKFNSTALKIVETADSICAEYAAAGYDLTLRQLYYQFVSRGLIENKDSEYKRLGDIVNTARLAGLIDWEHITDRTRNLRSLSHWENPRDIVKACASQYRIDKWDTQPVRVEVWVEKEALAGVIQRPCENFDVPWFCCRGYVSQSEMWGAAQRLLEHIKHGQSVVVIHLGDHDPSGIDMTRDIADRIRLFAEGVSVVRDEEPDLCSPMISVHRIALNMAQVDKYDPPPNPAKITDSRAGDYIKRFGDESWELDALEPATISALIESRIRACRNEDSWADALLEEQAHRHKLRLVADSMTS